MRRTIFVPVLLATLFLLPSCRGATEIILTVDRTTISAGGQDFCTIKAKALLYGEPISQKTPVAFDNSYSATPGSFDTAEGSVSVNRSPDKEGVATVKFYSNAKQGSSTVLVSFYDSDSGVTAEANVTITFGAASGKQMPVAGTFRMTCDAVNIGALRSPTPDIQVTCTLSAQTRGGESVPASALSPKLLAEAGLLTTKTDYYGKRVVVHSPRGGVSAPKDVTPKANLGEKGYYDKNGKQRNPRDGLVTLVAVVDGEEAFTDANGNGKWDSGEPFVDAAEPFVDADDDDIKGPAEKFLDANGNGKWDKANAKWDAKTKIMAVYKILWTGPLDANTNTSRWESSNAGGGFTIADSGKLDITAYLLDANANPLAAFAKNSDYLEFTLNAGSSDAYVSDTAPITLKNLIGFSFNTSASSERKRWMITPNSFSPPKYKITVEDYYQNDGTIKPLNYSVGATAYVTAGPVEDGYTTPVTEKFPKKAEGTCD